MNIVMTNLATNLRTLRKRYELSVRDVAEEIPMDPGYLSHLENGTRTNVTLQALYRIAQFYDVTINDLLREEDAHV